MKRIILLLTAVVISLALCACGRDESYEKYRDIINNLEDGNYQNAIDLIKNMADSEENGVNDIHTSASTDAPEKPALTPEQIAWQTNAVGTWIPDESAAKDGHTGFSVNGDGTCVVDGKNYTWTVDSASETSARLEVLDGQTKVHLLQLSVSADYGYKRASLYIYTDGYSAKSTNGTYYRNEDYTVVEITNDNWQDYFEVKEATYGTKNAFGEISDFFGYSYFGLKETYGVVNSILSKGGTEYQFDSSCQDVTVNLTDMTYVPAGDVKNTAERNSTSEWRYSTIDDDRRYYGVSIDSFHAYDVNKELTDTVWRPLNIEIVRVQGTLYFVK